MQAVRLRESLLHEIASSCTLAFQPIPRQAELGIMQSRQNSMPDSCSNIAIEQLDLNITFPMVALICRV